MKFLKDISPYVVIIITVILFRSYIITPVRVNGESMDNTLKNGQILILNKVSSNYKRFDIVVIKYGNERIIKRIIGLPGEDIKYEDNKLFVNGNYIDENFSHSETYNFNLSDITTERKIPDGYYLVLGDNRLKSYDSREIGLIKKTDIEGKTGIRIFPFNKIGKI